MHDIEEVIDSEEFNREFWEWFDALPETQRRTFDYYKSDMSKIFFYNTVWKYRLRVA